MRDGISGDPGADLITEEQEEVDEIHFGHIPQIPSHSWPKAIGIVQLCSGFFTTMLGVAEIFLIPLLMDLDDPYPWFINKRNCYGTGLWAGIVMVLLGSTAVRASISKRASSIKKFFSLTLFTLLLYTVLTSVLIYGYIAQWTTREDYLYEVHIFVTISTIIGFIFAITAFVQYYELVCFGRYNLHHSIFLCLLPCIFPVKRTSTSEDSLTEGDRYQGY
ncbi:uncharacterized protein LOC128175367 isoform X1 [Crassostrea angulata]|uniref:uncharacterized protein LOC128175367 isoform X1 n=1 Tax=Magallana angulata TaxID=2784310 RepID=UPI0022B1221D|nr:uncharacterized protein LOC128175367 isoform X1 [Crassostrea angulata]XP_052696904.1 uncharacterized protein LOC128175367 isoform X1 [Crassostrea angulata]